MSLRATQGIVLFLGAGALILGFQNCTNVDFEKVQGELTKAQNTPVDVTQSSIEPLEIDEVETTNSGIIEAPPTTVPRAHGKNKEKHHQGNGLVLCGLPGPGKSVVVGVRADGSMAQNSTASAACMSVSACEDIVGAHVEAQAGVRGRGICKEGKSNVVYLSDDEVQALVDKEFLN